MKRYSALKKGFDMFLCRAGLVGVDVIGGGDLRWFEA